MEIKIYKCKICKKRGKEFSGIKQKVRLHLREEHGIRGKLKDGSGKKVPSSITRDTIVEEFK